MTVENCKDKIVCSECPTTHKIERRGDAYRLPDGWAVVELDIETTVFICSKCFEGPVVYESR